MTDHALTVFALILAIPSLIVGCLAFVYGNIREMSKAGARRRAINLQRILRLLLLTRTDTSYSVAQIGLRLALICIGCTAFVGFGILFTCTFFSSSQPARRLLFWSSICFEAVGTLLTFYNFIMIYLFVNPNKRLHGIHSELGAMRKKYGEQVPEVEEAILLAQRVLAHSKLSTTNQPSLSSGE